MLRHSKQRLARHRSCLPEGFAPGQTEGSESADVGQGLQLTVAQLSADGDVINRREGALGARNFKAFGSVLTQISHVLEAEPEREGLRAGWRSGFLLRGCWISINVTT